MPIRSRPVWRVDPGPLTLPTRSGCPGPSHSGTGGTQNLNERFIAMHLSNSKASSGLLTGGRDIARKAGEGEWLCSYRVHEIAPKRTHIHGIASGPRVAAALCVVGGRFAARGPVSAVPG